MAVEPPGCGSSRSRPPSPEREAHGEKLATRGGSARSRVPATIATMPRCRSRRRGRTASPTAGGTSRSRRRPPRYAPPRERVAAQPAGRPLDGGGRCRHRDSGSPGLAGRAVSHDRRFRRLSQASSKTSRRARALLDSGESRPLLDRELVRLAWMDKADGCSRPRWSGRPTLRRARADRSQEDLPGLRPSARSR